VEKKKKSWTSWIRRKSTYEKKVSSFL
jgi:hypothetical protein